MLEYNRKFVAEKQYEPYKTSKYSDKKIAIVTCMDTRLDVRVSGYVMDSVTGEMKRVEE